MNNNPPRAERFFDALLLRPRILIFLCFALFGISVVSLPTMFRDTSVEGFIPKHDPVRQYRDQVREIFGLDDPMVIAVSNRGESGVFNPTTLNLVARLAEAVAEVPGIDPDAITSLASENHILGTPDGMMVEPLLEEPPQTQDQANQVRDAVMGFPLYVGSLVGRGGETTLIVAELLDDADASEVYLNMQALAESFPHEQGDELYVAGEGAVAGYLAYYIDQDARRLNPLAGLIITFILIISFRTVRGAVLPNLLVLGAVGCALGTMAFFQVPFYVITNALPVLLIAIAVADGIHILDTYYENIAHYPELSHRQIVVRTMGEMWRPVTLTTITDMAGFMAIFAASYMPPMKYFGLFASLGVALALLFALVLLPAALVLMRKKPSPKFAVNKRPDMVARLMKGLAGLVWQRAGLVVALSGLVVILGLVGALRLKVNDERIDSFAKSEPLPQADRVINQTTDGSHYLDVLIDTGAEEGLFAPSVLKQLEGLQQFGEGLPHVKGSVSIVDYVKQMNRVLNEDQDSEWRLPENPDLVAQYFLLYTASGDPTDFDHLADGTYARGNVRLRLDTQNYAVIDQTVLLMEQYIADNFNQSELTATVSGAVKLHQHWLSILKNNHFLSVGFSLLAIFIVASLSFRSLAAGLFALLPVSVSLLFLYAVMGYTGMTLSVGTSMFAAISLGAGIDFAIHSIDRFQLLIRQRGMSFQQAFATFYAGTGRALFYSFACLLFGFGVLVTSSVVPLIRFGTLMGVSALASFFATMTLLPALFKLVQPSFLGLVKEKPEPFVHLVAEPVSQ